jgi:biopolymer transport protein ExbD
MGRPRSEINVTPLVDVDRADALFVSITRDEGRTRIWWDRDPLADADALRRQVAQDLSPRTRPLYVKAASDLTFGDVYPALVAIHQGGAEGVQLATEELKLPR